MDGWRERLSLSRIEAERRESKLCEGMRCVALCISLLKKNDEWCSTAFWMQKGKECAKKKEEEEG